MSSWIREPTTHREGQGWRGPVLFAWLPCGTIRALRDPGPTGRLGGLTFLLLLLVLAWPRGFCAWAADREELRDAVEATYIYKFAPFVIWPAPAQGPIRLCIAGEDGVTALIPNAVKGQSVDGRPIQVQTLDAGGAPDGCTILYSAASAGPAILGAAQGKPILTVAEVDGKSAPPAIITLLVVSGHVRFDIDEALAAKAGLTMSSKLLSLAHAVLPAKGAPP